MTEKKGMFIVVSGPSGVGKGTICKKLLDKLNAWYSVSVTTREKRDGEIEGKNYYFVTEEEFKEKIKNNELLEYAIYNNNYYGTLKSTIENKLDKGIDVFSEIEVKGAKNIKRRYPNSLLIYILPPSIKELRNRLEKRQANDEKDIERRIKIAYQEFKSINKYDYVVVNKDIDETVNILTNIIKSEKYRTSRAALDKFLYRE